MNTEIIERTEIADDTERVNEPLPQAALLRNGELYTPHQLMLPNGDRFGTTFDIHDDFMITHVSIRYADRPPTVIELGCPYWVEPNYTFTLWLNRS